jgi:hypothetical protein
MCLVHYILLHCCLPGELADLLQVQQKYDVLSVTPSRASMSLLQKIVQRLDLQFTQGLPFQLPSQTSGLENFIWPGNEADGYADACDWLQEHVCPVGVTAILKDRDKWLEWSVLRV